MSKVRMIDLARELGVTTVTISNALNNRPGVSEAMRSRIIAKADEMGYSRQAYATDSGRKIQLGVLVPAYFLSEPKAFYWAFFHAISREAERHGMDVRLEELSAGTLRNMVLPKLAQNPNCQFLIMLGPPGRSYLEMLYSQTRQPIVCLDCSAPSFSQPSIVSANYYGMATMTEYLIEAGHEDIGFLGTVGSTESITERYLGYKRALLTHDLKMNPDWVLDDRKIQNGKVMIELPETLPTAFVCNSDRSAVDLVEVLAKVGKRVPEDISLVSYDGYLPVADELSLTTMAVDFGKMAAATFQVLTAILDERDPAQLRYVIPGHLIEGDSVRPVSVAAR